MYRLALSSAAAKRPPAVGWLFTFAFWCLTRVNGGRGSRSDLTR